MHAVAAYAAHIVLAMRRALEIRMLSLVAAQASRIDLLCRRLRRIEDLRYITAAVDVRFARPVAALTRYAALSMHLGDFGVRIGRESL